MCYILKPMPKVQINNDSFILFLDYYKAFDTLEHNFLFQALKKIGFGDWFCKMVKMLYVNGNIFIKLKNSTSPRFFLDRGVRQGCPVSPYLFLIAVQFLNLHIICICNQKGIIVGTTNWIISQLAADAALFLEESSQIPIALNILQSFSKASCPSLKISCTAALLPELKPAPCFLSAIIGRTWLIQVCLIIVAVTTELRHTWINQFGQ